MFGTSKLRVAAATLMLVAGACGDDGINKLPDGGTVDAGVDAPPAQPGQLRLATNTANFGTVVIGQTSAAMSVTVANTGMGPTGTISAAIAGASGSNFAIASTTCTTLAPAATCTISVTFTPSSMGVKAASLSVTASPGGTVMAALEGTGIAPGALTITPSTFGFPNTLSGQTSATQTFTVQNTGGTTSGTLTTTTGGSNPGEFTKVTDTCNAMTLAANATCTFTVRFAPQSAGAKFATFTVGGTPGGTVVAAVNGLALSPAQLVVNPENQNFGSVVVGSTSANVTINVVNIGGVATGALSQTLTGAGSGEFTILSSTCNLAVLQPGGGCNVIARFTPTAAAAATAALTFNGTPGGTVVATLSGTGIAAGALVIAPTTNTYPNTTVGSTTTPFAFTVTNNGGAATGPLTTSLTGTDAGQFTITANTCAGSALAAGLSCSVSVAFAPTTAGVKAAILSVGGTPGGTVTASLNGNALPLAALAISPNIKDFGSVGVGGQTAYQVFTIQNQGGGNTGVPTVTLTGTNPGQFTFVTDCTMAIAPINTCTVSVRFMPTAIGNFAATLQVSASPGGTVTANVFGQGVDPAALSVNPSSLPFPNITLIGDTTGTLSFTVTNNGGSTTGALSVTPTGANAGDFNVVSTTCTTLAPGGTCTATVNFQPTARGTRTATILVSGTPGGSVGVAVSGEALPRLEIISVDEEDPVSPFDFGTSSVNPTQVRLVEIEVRNNTDDDHVFNLSPAFGAPEQFDIWNVSCNGGGKGKKNPSLIVFGKGPTIIEAHDECYVYVRFDPTSTGPKAGSIVFDIGPTQFDTASQAFIGNGADGLSIAALTTSNFGPTATDSTSPALTFRVTNASDAQTTSTMTTTVLQSNRFRVLSDACAGNTISPGATCDLRVVFEPTILGADVAVLGVSATVGGTPTINLAGTGVTGFTVGGMVSGHTGSVTLRNNGYDDVVVPVGQSGFTFGDRVGSNYTVTVAVHPPLQACSVVSGGSGIINNANVNDVMVVCVEARRSCADIKLGNPAATSGFYNIDPDAGGPGAPMNAYCDMTYLGGGWTNIDFTTGRVYLENGNSALCTGGVSATSTTVTCVQPIVNSDPTRGMYNYLCDGSDQAGEYILDHMSLFLGHQNSLTVGGWTDQTNRYESGNGWPNDEEYCYANGNWFKYNNAACSAYWIGSPPANGNCYVQVFVLTRPSAPPL